MTDPTDRILDVAREAGRSAAAVCRAVLGEAPAAPEAMAKLGKEPVTVADYGSQAVILRAVQAAFPEHGVIAEEGAEHLRENAGDHGSQQIVRLVGQTIGEEVSFDQVCSWIDHDGSGGSEFTWSIDPIDGTKGFLRRQQFAVAIGILRHGKPYAGVLACPNLPLDPADPNGAKGLLYFAADGRGAWREPIDGGETKAVKVSPHQAASDVRVLGSVESAHGDPALVKAVIEDLGLSGGMVRIDSQVKYAVVAHGGAEVYLRPRSKPEYRENIWDHTAGVIVTLEAGGRVTDLDGKDLDFSLGKKLAENRGVLATNGAVHQQVLESLRRVEAAKA
ncbi:MAG: 3'(2'),5'-bisphosphate nucleotidase [Planctomycetota bacterium]|nr:MAG: 3'(2'),5'-bisphosphate nucleotidase [Planctomycetota bacterium]